MVRADLKGVFRTKKVRKDGSTSYYWYHRRTGLRLHGEPGSPEFIADLARAQTVAKPEQSADNVIGLIRDYTLSVEFEQKLAPSTQREYRRMLTTAEAKFGTMPVAALEDRRVLQDLMRWRDELARKSGPREADNRLSVFSAMMKWAKAHGRLTQNVLAGFQRLYHSDRSELIWLPEHIDAFWGVAPIELQRALMIGLHTGLRQGDILSLPWSAYDGAELRLRIGKNSRRGKVAPLVRIPCTKALMRMLDGIPRVSPLILTTKTGRAFQKRYFAELWEQTTKAAGIELLHFNDLRGTAVTMLSEAQCTPQEISTITKHKLESINTILERYLARTRGLADQAIFKWENSPRTEFANRLQTGAPALKSK